MSKGKIRLNNYHHPHKYLVLDEGNNDNDAFPGQRKICDIWDWNTDNGQANAKELVRRWNAFEKDGLVDELRKACESLVLSLECLRLEDAPPCKEGDWCCVCQAVAAIAKVS